MSYKAIDHDIRQRGEQKLSDSFSRVIRILVRATLCDTREQCRPSRLPEEIDNRTGDISPVIIELIKQRLREARVAKDSEHTRRGTNSTSGNVF